ncbi:glycosyltransferase family 4 protein [Streptosporangium carneum]|uniref:Glycosyltransferase n=1 Tax=Streptosporangium carneum TaxID=47481 RepID=A0A9W6IBW8_9ACTN|nr:MraY family glycosyltransferase [Streptosporangium carneum]GLK15318.1 putative glycosyltransferase [Streptosporangium carneum]
MISGESLAVAASTGAAAFVLVAVFTELIRRFALRLKIVDRPAASRPHRRPTPYLGGVAIVAGTLLPATALARDWDLRIVTIMISAVIVALLGVIDDCRPLRPLWRLAVEGVAAALVVASGVRLEFFGNWIDAAGTLMWIVFVTNSFNMIDNTDGVLGSIGAAGASVLSVTALISGQPTVALLLLAMAFGCVGFVAHNWNPARIFMGDAGSLFIGFTLSTCAVMVFGQTEPVTALPCLLLFTFVPALDTCLAIVARQRAGRPWLIASPDHLAHRCVAAGFSPRQIALVMGGATAATSLLGMHILLGWVPGAFSLAGLACVGVTLVAILVRAPGRYPTPAVRPRRVRREKSVALASSEGRH